MPTVNLQNDSGEPLFLGRPDGRRVEAGEIIHLEGSLSKDSPEDAFLVGDGDDARLYPKAIWKMTTAKGKGDPDVPAPSKGSE